MTKLVLVIEFENFLFVEVLILHFWIAESLVETSCDGTLRYVLA